MHFDYTYIVLAGFKIFEPMVGVTNLIFLLLSLIFFNRLIKFKAPYSRHMGYFILSLGISMLIGAIGHMVHMQAGESFFKGVLFMMNVFSLISVYHCFRAAYTLWLGNAPFKRKYMYWLVGWLLGMVIASVLIGEFWLIKVNAGLVLVYALLVHVLHLKRQHGAGDRLVITGIGISFLSIFSHSLGISFGEWFNHKDVAHVIMIISLIVIYSGARKNVISAAA